MGEVSMFEKLRKLIYKDEDLDGSGTFFKPEGGSTAYPYMESAEIPGVIKHPNPTPTDPGITADQLAETQLQGASITRFFGETFNPYAYSTFRGLYTYDEPSFYSDYEESYKQNPFTSMVTHYLLNQIISNGYHFEGPGAKVAEEFFVLDNTRQKINTCLLEAIKKGNGFMDYTLKGKKLISTRNLITDDVIVTLDAKTGLRLYEQGGKKLREEFMIHMMVRESVGIPYGISLFRQNLVFLTALMDVGGDVMAALKRVAYAPIVASLDFEGVPEGDRATVMTKWKEKLQNMESATQNFVIDKKHELTLLGQGAAGAKLLPTNEMIAPIISVVLINFGVPLGMFLQTGANKAIIEEQRSSMERFYEEIRTKLKLYIETKLLPYVTSRGTILVFNRPPLTDEKVAREFELFIEAFKAGLVSREFTLDHFDLEDNGKTLVPLPSNEKETPPDNKKPPVTKNE
jgi:hypothetical protein